MLLAGFLVALMALSTYATTGRTDLALKLAAPALPCVALLLCSFRRSNSAH